MANATLNGISIHYEVFGPADGTPIILCAPGGFDSTIEKWRTAGVWPEADPLDALPAAGYRVVAYDRRESGESGGRFEALSWDLYAHEIDGVRRELSLGKVWLLGGCMGCSAAFSYAVRYPDNVAGLLLHWPIGGEAFYDHARDVWFGSAIAHAREQGMTAVVELAREKGSMMADVKAGPWAPVIARDEAFAEMMASLEPETYIEALERTRDNLFPRDHEAPGAEPEQLRALDVPVFIAPGDDPFHAPSAAAYLAEQLPRAESWVPRLQQDGKGLIAEMLSFLGRHAS
ncbi:MAG: alpha/beta hydrolase [Dehalococcoidia bacterium]